MKCGILFFFLFFENASSLSNSQNPERLAWQRQIDRVKENERRLEEFIANQAKKGGEKRKSVDVKSKTFDIFRTNPLKNTKQNLANNSIFTKMLVE